MLINQTIRQQSKLAALLLALVASLLLGTPAQSQDPSAPDDAVQAKAAKGIVQLRGQTMGTLYMVKIFDPPELDKDLPLLIDAELRRVNDQMSTYLKSSELGRFNATDSTDWFPVSKETAEVVAYAQAVAEKTGGAFDVTVGPLVNAWSFGPTPRDRTVPDSETLAELSKSVGYKKLSVRTDPPALRKEVPGLQVDLSAIAKGHGVDRVVELLDSLGIENVFVEIGGEVRTSGQKGDQWWQVGIELPTVDDSKQELIAHGMSTRDGRDESMATSGDYRNYFEADGKRYSHTIDPRRQAPIEHGVASVSVIAPTCMAADAWATAINVVGVEEGLQLAASEKMSVLVSERKGDELVLHGTGVLAKYAQAGAEVAAAEAPAIAPNGMGNLVAVVILTALIFAIILVGMGLGVMLRGKPISGSCGGLSSKTGEDGSVSCSLCSNPSDACKELRERMKEDGAPAS